MKHWTLDDIPWDQFDRSKAAPELIALAKAACLVEYNGADYARYLNEVFHDDKAFQATADAWAIEEIQHGQVLRKWAEIADPTFDFDKCFEIFTTGYKLPVNVTESVRGSRCGELVARCVVEVGTSSYYTALKESTDEPVLQAICAKIAADEFRHYKLFYDNLQVYLKREDIGTLKRIAVVMSRMAESEDDELAYAYYAANADTKATQYDHAAFKNLLMLRTLRIFRRHHIDRMAAMVLKAAGLKPNGRLNSNVISPLMWQYMRFRTWKLERIGADVLKAA